MVSERVETVTGANHIGCMIAIIMVMTAAVAILPSKYGGNHVMAAVEKHSSPMQSFPSHYCNRIMLNISPS